jgi:hypothetical protein
MKSEPSSSRRKRPAEIVKELNIAELPSLRVPDPSSPQFVAPPPSNSPEVKAKLRQRRRTCGIAGGPGNDAAAVAGLSLLGRQQIAAKPAPVALVSSLLVKIESVFGKLGAKLTESAAG